MVSLWKWPLKKSLEIYKVPIATSFDEKSSLPQPRLLLASVDVVQGATVTFDSYETEDGTRKSEYKKLLLTMEMKWEVNIL